jgi:hypothetical protein
VTLNLRLLKGVRNAALSFPLPDLVVQQWGLYPVIFLELWVV